MSEYLSNKVQKMKVAATLVMSQKAREMRAKGLNVISLSIGEPDFDTPQNIKAAAVKALDEGFTKYTAIQGLLSLRKAICHKIKSDLGLEYSPNQVVVSNGAKQSIANVCIALLEPGDEVILPVPYWVSYENIVCLNQAKVVSILTDSTCEFKINAEQLENAITDRTKLIIYSSPCNPTGGLYSKMDLAPIVEVLERNPHVFILSDEIYEYINYTDQHESIAQFESIRDRVILVNGLSKAYAMTGWRIGYMLANETIARACQNIQGMFTSGASSFGQKAAEFALLHAREDSLSMVKAFKARRDMLKPLLDDIPGFITALPQGAFYFFPDVSAYFGMQYQDFEIKNSTDFCNFILEKALVAIVPGSAFGLDGYVRISYAASEKVLIEAVQRMKKALALLE